jgi:hypothetical protein
MAALPSPGGTASPERGTARDSAPCCAPRRLPNPRTHREKTCP